MMVFDDISRFGGHLNFNPWSHVKECVFVCVCVPSGIRILLDSVSLRRHSSRQVSVVAEICRLGQRLPNILHSCLCRVFMSFLG